MQTARGASLSDADNTGDLDRATSALRSAGSVRLLFVAVALVLVLIDQATKAWAVAQLTPGEPKDLLGSLLRLHLTRNPGAAFSTGTSHTGIFTALAAIVSVVVIWVAMRARSRAWAVALGFLFAGVFGNLVDRVVREPGVFRGHVVDFLELPHWPIFNVADICINVAAVLILILAYRGIRLGGGSSRDDAAGDGSGGSSGGSSGDGSDVRSDDTGSAGEAQ